MLPNFLWPSLPPTPFQDTHIVLQHHSSWSCALSHTSSSDSFFFFFYVSFPYRRLCFLAQEVPSWVHCPPLHPLPEGLSVSLPLLTSDVRTVPDHAITVSVLCASRLRCWGRLGLLSCFCLLEVRSGSAQVLLLALGSGLTPGIFWEIFVILRIKSGLFQASVLPVVLSLWPQGCHILIPVIKFFFVN